MLAKLLVLETGAGSGEPTGFPMIHGIPVTKYKADGTGLDIGYAYPWDSYGFCEINVDYKDHVIPVCVGSYKILRTWKLVDWCTNEIVEHTQIIKVVDAEASIDGPGDIALKQILILKLVKQTSIFLMVRFGKLVVK